MRLIGAAPFLRLQWRKHIVVLDSYEKFSESIRRPDAEACDRQVRLPAKLMEVALQVCFDESGNTGQDLLSSDQPVYVLASVAVAPDVAFELVRSAAARSEFHFKQARRSSAGREQIVRLLSAAQLTPETVKLLGVHKGFMVTTKMVDLLVEPIAHAFNFDLYADGLHLALSNLWHAAMPVLGSREAFVRVQRSFIAMVRRPEETSVATFITAVDAMEDSWRGTRPEEAFALWRLGAKLQQFGSAEIPDLDPAPPAFIALAHDWSEQAGPFEVIHDQHRGMEHWKSVLARFWPEEARQQVFVGHSGRSFRYPLPIDGLAFVDSRTDPRVQVADAVAGAGRSWLASLVDPSRSDVLTERLSETPVQDWFSPSSVWPTHDFSPDELGVVPGATPNIAGAVAQWLTDHS